MQETEQDEKIGAVLVCGAGIAGIQASLDLANGGFKVYLLEPTAAIGGRMAQLDKTYTSGDCASCILSPKLVECARNRNIEIITLADVESVSGNPGNFKVKIRQNPRYIDLKKCDACGDCEQVCPVTLPSEFDCGMGNRKAAFRPYPQAIPNVFSISKSTGQAPCRALCPAGVNVPGFAALTAAGKLEEAYSLIRQRCPLPAVSGRICHHPCESKCNRGEVDEAVASCDLERFIADYVYENPGRYPAFPQPAVLLDRKVAVIGGGPAGLTAAADLAMLGYRVTIFEARAHLGGMLRYGIPAYRLPKDVLDREIQNILQLGIEVRTGVSIAKPADLLISGTRAGSAQGGFDAVFVATGAWVGRKPGIPGDNALGVWEGLHFLQEFNDGKVHTIGSSVLVIGSSDLALEAARCARRVPGVNSVDVVGLESSGELKADPRLVAEVVQDGVNFRYSLGPTGIDAEPGKAISVAFRACTSVYNKYKRFDPLFDDSVTSTIVADTVIVSGDRGVDSVRFGLETRPGGRIVADKDSLATSVKGIFAGGDAVLGSASMVDAVAQGHRAAESIEAYIRGTVAIRRTAVSRTSASVPQSSGTVAFAPNPRAESKLKEKGSSFEPRAEKISGLDQATAEARRCLNCGLCSECMLCVEACSAGAILHDQQPTELEIEVGSIILAPGFEEAQESFKEGLGRERYANVISSLQFERILSLSEPSGQLPRPSDGLDAKRIAFIQCVGSRNETHDYCSSVCCMNAAKEALDALERTGGGVREAWIFGKEIRPVGKESDAYINRAREEHGVHFVRTASSHVREIAENRNLKITYSADGKDLEQEFDLVVLSKGLQVSESVKQMAGRLGVQLNPFGFAQTQRFSPLAASTPGIYLAGAFQEPKDIPESVAQASGAAACAMSLLTTVRGTLTRRREYPWERDVYDEPARIGVFVCHCGHNIASVVDVEWVARKAAKMPNVCYAEATMYTCSDSNQQHIRDLIRKHRLNRLVVASCSSRTHEMLFQETLRESGLNQYLFSMTNIRDQCSWVHRDNPAAATAKALDLVSMAVARARYLKAFPLIELEVAPSALVLGGGLAGMTAALGIADQGYKVHLVEREPALGGLLRTMYRTLEQEDVQAKLEELTAKTRSHPNISVYLNSNLVRTSGQVGDFTSVVDVAGEEKTLKHGAVIVATGGIAKTTSRYLHGSNPHVITQVALESALGKDDLPEELRGRKDPAVVMIQCVESRDEKTPYCSRVCCSEAIKNALEIKRRLPDSRIVILNRDIRTDGFRDMYFRKARQEGIQFITFPDGGPEVAEDNGRITVKTRDMDAGNEVTLQPDLLVLSTGISPAAGNAALSGMLRSALTSDGFFMEAHSRLRPVDLSNEGEFLCGLAHSPRFMDETIAQALAAAGRASRILSKSLLEVAGQVSYVNPAECVACATCVKVCPYGAPVINAIGKSEIQGAKCMGCGSCVSACPAKAIALQHQESRTVMAMLDEMLAGGGF